MQAITGLNPAGTDLGAAVKGSAMKSRHQKPFNRPFRHLKSMVEKKSPKPAPWSEPIAAAPPTSTKLPDDELFAKAMEDVTPLDHNTHWRFPRKRIDMAAAPDHEDEECVIALERLIEAGEGFIVSQTDEYMEARGPGVNPRIVKRLHQGRYSLQDYIDLHGWFEQEAQIILHRFIRDSIRRGYRAVLVIHGRGLKSPHQPVLKKMVLTWLTRGPLRAYIIALASARPCDGGAGATYVMLRRRPIGKRQRKAHPPR